jgi:hypothetical protein
MMAQQLQAWFGAAGFGTAPPATIAYPFWAG